MMVANSPRSRKAKGRIFQNDISSHFRNLCSSNAYYSLHPDRLNLEIKPALMGESGVDIKFTGPSLDLIPFDIECKNHERWNVPKFWDQTLSNCGSDRIPLLCLKRNRSDSLVVLRLVDLYDSRILRFI